MTTKQISMASGTVVYSILAILRIINSYDEHLFLGGRRGLHHLSSQCDVMICVKLLS